MKFSFTQTIDLDSGANNVTLVGLDGYLQEIIGELPSSTGKAVDCDVLDSDPLSASLRRCSWQGLSPNVLANYRPDSSSLSAAPYSNHTHNPYASWLDYNITTPSTINTTNHTATFHLRGTNTKACRLLFNNPVSHISVADTTTTSPSSSDSGGSTQLRLFSRTWDKRFSVTVSWPEDQQARGQRGKVECLWSDANTRGVIPAWDEVRRFAPVWAVGVKGGDGLVEGWKGFEV